MDFDLETITQISPLLGFLVMAYEAHRFAKQALRLAEESSKAVAEVASAVTRLSVITESLDRRLEVLEDRGGVAHPIGFQLDSEE